MSSEPLYQMSLLTDFVRLLIWTGQIPDERPGSAIFVAPAGAGKTTLLENNECDQAKFFGDLTSRPLHGILKNDKLTHVMVGDMLSIFGHSKHTVKLTIQSISAFSGEGLTSDPWTGEPMPARKLGLLTAIPPEDIEKRDIKRHIFGGGFASRFMIVRYSYRPSTIAAIHNFIAENKYAADDHFKKFTLENPGKYEVKLPVNVAAAIKDLSTHLKTDPLGFRAHRYIRALVKAQARRQNRNVAKIEDFRLIQTYCDFFTSEGKAI